MKHINTIEIKNFKSIRHQKIEGCKRINVFIGYPNVGKSNILEALTTIQYAKLNVFKPQKDFFRFEDAADLFFEANIKEPVSVAYNKDKIIFLGYINKDGVRFSAADYQEGKGGLSNDDDDKSLELIDVFKYDFRSQRIQSDSSVLTRLDSPFGDNLFLILRDDLKLRQLFNDILEPYDIRLLIDRTSNSIKLIKSLDADSIFQIPYSLLADTLQRLLFYQIAIRTNENSVLLFEEPEAHMFPPYVRKFTADVIFDKTNQFFIATHSPYVLDSFMEDAMDDLAIFLVYYEDGETKLKRLEHKEIEEIKEYGVDLFYNLESYLKNGQINNA